MREGESAREGEGAPAASAALRIRWGADTPRSSWSTTPTWPTDQDQIFYAFTSSKEGEPPARLPKGYQGRLLLEHGELPLHNHLSERMLRHTVVGRKDWLFARSEGSPRTLTG